ncbi:dehydrogenase/reductase SDR family member 7B isoform X2 [Sorex araneus]|uniref:dehydrogenase/reductase SDR family member 7B isoform X2 n=1 Tax=Sorex araneus TaxID=42254 RepID=UPI002433A5CD|nr:dehydrogenase/reductase SDR family member 7B isoform X2 [Sorex araneus]
MISAAARKCWLKVRAMDFVSSTAILPLLVSCVGIYSVFKLLKHLFNKTYIQNSVVVITGATSGLGRECARVFYAVGAKLVLCGRNKEALEELTEELMASPTAQDQAHKPCTVVFDLTDLEAITESTAEILDCFGYVDVLINNAGISYRGDIIDTSIDVDKKVMDTNYFGPVALTKDAASKHATQAFFDCLRAEMEQYGIEVTVISPGYIHTNLSLNAITSNGSRYGVMDKNTAEGRSPKEVAQDVLTAVGEKKKDVVLATLVPSLAIYLRTLAPGIFFSLMASRARKEQKPKDA